MKLVFVRTFNNWFEHLNKRPALAATVSTLWVMLVGGVAFFWNLGNIGLIDETEPLFAEASRQMLLTGDWITPYFNGETRFDKPALIYWFQGILYAVIGVNEWAVRLPSAIAATVVLGLAFYTINWHLSEKNNFDSSYPIQRRWLIAANSIGIMAFNISTIVWGRIGVSDMLLTGCIASCLFCFFLGYAQPEKTAIKTRWYLASYILIGTGILTKGPVALVLPGLTVGGFLLYLGKVREVLKEMRWLVGMLIIGVISLPWYILVSLRNPETYIQSFFGYHNVERFTGVVNGHTAPWYFYFIVVLLGFAPYSVYLPVAIYRLKFWQVDRWRSLPRFQHLGLFAFFWFIAIFGFFTIATTKLPSYVLPLMPAAAILVALSWDELIEGKKQERQQTPKSSPLLKISTWIKISAWLNIVLTTALSVGMFYLPKLLGRDPAAPNLSQLLKESHISEIGGMIWLLASLSLGFLIIRRHWRSLLNVNLLAFVAFFIFALTPAFFFIDSQRQQPLRELSAMVTQIRQPQEELMMVGFKKPSISFYSRISLINYQKFAREAGAYLRNEKEKKPQSPSILVIAQPKRFPEMRLQLSDYQVIEVKGAYQLARVSIPLNSSKINK
jgi:4-amino-4-deoxy-L-arabinose transferase-like glycosyltransferase